MRALSFNRTARLLAAALAVLALMGAAYLFGVRAGEASSESARAAARNEAAPNLGPLGEQSRRQEGDPLALGPVDAPVVMVVFSDYRCPFCARHSRVTEPVLIERFVDSGQLRIEWRDFPVFGEASMVGARAGRAAAAQGKFWEFNQAVYRAAPENGHHDLNPQKLRDFAVRVGIPDLDRFEREMNSDMYDEEIARDATQARLLGITGTPSFVVGGHPLVGAQPTDFFVRVIEQVLQDTQL